jgi:hypothetical protein
MRVPTKAAVLLCPALVAAAAISVPRHETPDSVEDVSDPREPTILWQSTCPGGSDDVF